MGKKRIFDEEEDAAAESVEAVDKEEDTPVVQPVVKRVKVVKPLPPGYVCKACGAVDDHAIYNCTRKVAKKDTEKEVAAAAAVPATETTTTPAAAANDTPAEFKKYVFVSGLPFDTNKAKLLDLVKDKMEDPESCTLEMRDFFIVTFKDNPQKCRGLAYITCHSEKQFQDCLNVQGIKLGRFDISAVESATSNASARKPIDNVEFHKHPSKKEKKEKQGPRCYRCGGAHDPKTCENQRICYKCRGNDHLSKDCPKKKSK
jgi:hypothetical protein